MALIITSQEQFIIIRPSTPSIRDEIQFKFSVISSCEAQNNFTMEFEYLIYSNSSILDHTVLQCGVVCLSFINPGHPIEIWGHSYGIIQYTMPSNTELATTSSDYTELAATSNDYTELATTSSDSNMCTTTKPGIARQAASWSSGSIAIVVVVASIIVCVSLVVGLLYMKYRSHKKIAVLEEQVLLTNVVHNTNEEETKILRQMEEELPAEQTSNPSPTHTNLNQKLPDIISSRDDK